MLFRLLFFLAVMFTFFFMILGKAFNFFDNDISRGNDTIARTVDQKSDQIVLSHILSPDIS